MRGFKVVFNSYRVSRVTDAIKKTALICINVNALLPKRNIANNWQSHVKTFNMFPSQRKQGFNGSYFEKMTYSEKKYQAKDKGILFLDHSIEKEQRNIYTQ